jgi:hypothetical protein
VFFLNILSTGYLDLLQAQLTGNLFFTQYSMGIKKDSLQEIFILVA